LLFGGEGEVRERGGRRKEIGAWREEGEELATLFSADRTPASGPLREALTLPSYRPPGSLFFEGKQ